MNETPETVTPPAAPLDSTSSERQSRFLFVAAGAAVAATIIYYALTSKLSDPLLLYQGAVILVLATLPGLIWARNPTRQLPLFEVLMLTTANTYALPLFNGQQTLQTYSTEVIETAALAVIVYQIAAITMYYAVRGLRGRTPFFTDEVIAHDIHRYIGYGLTITTIYTYVSIFTEVIPFDLAGPLRAGFAGIGLISVFVQARRWGAGELPPHDKMIFLTNVVIQLVLQFSTLFLVGGVAMLVLLLIGYVTGSRRPPIMAALIALLGVALLHNGKGAMRNKYWEASGVRHHATLTELPGFFSEWVQFGLSPPQAEEADEKITAKLLDRTSLMHILCLIVSYTPDRQPFLGGETYGHIPGQFVPRFFWKDKPPAHVSTYRLSIYYGLQTEEGTSTTTIGFGMVPEAYANFGMFGVGLLGLVLGAFYKKVQTLTRDSPQLSYAGLCVIVLMAWSFQTEYPMSMWLSSMSQSFIAVTGIPFLIRNILG